MKRHLEFLGLVLISSTAFAFNAHKPFDIKADAIDYQDDSQEITAEGHVVVVQSTSSVSADYLQYDHANNRLYARGHVVLREGDRVLAGEVMDYDLVKESGHVVGSKMFASPWKLQAENWERERDYYLGTQAAATSCDLIDPHFHIQSSRMHVIPGRYFWSWNNLMYVDETPSFYSPFVYKSLEKRRVVLQIEPGHDNVNGAFARTTTTVRFTDKVYDKILYDYYALTGNGFGNEFDYAPNKSLKGSLFGYYIDPKGNPELEGAPKSPQYNIRSYHWENLQHGMTLQSNVNIRDNVSFNNQFFQQDINQSVNDIDNSVALSQQSKRFTQHLVAEQIDSPDLGDTSLFAPIHTQTASYPRYDITMYQQPLWSPKVSTTTYTPHVGPLELSASGSLDDRYERADGLTRRIANGQFTLSETIPMGRHFTFTPSFSPSLRWQDRPDPLTLTTLGVSTTTASTGTIIPINLFTGAQGRVSNSDTLRYRPLNSLTLDNTYTLTERMAPNGVGLDRALQDGGVETNHLSWLLFWRPSRTILMRSYSGYDFREIADEDPNFFKQRRVDPWTSEYTYTPLRSPFDYFARYQLSYYPFRTSLSEASIGYNGLHKTRIESAVLYNQGEQGVVTWNNTLGYYFSPGWRLDAVIHSFIPTAGDAVGKVIDSQFSVVRDMHCWEAQFIYRYLPPFTQQYSILFSLKLGGEALKEIQNNDLESQFYPWRANAYGSTAR